MLFRSNLWTPDPDGIDFGDGTVLVPIIKISSACKKAESMLFDIPDDYSDYGYDAWDSDFL